MKWSLAERLERWLLPVRVRIRLQLEVHLSPQTY